MSVEIKERKWAPGGADLKEIPDSIKKKLYDSDPMCLFGSCMVKASPFYIYIEGEHTTTGNPLILSTGISFDGGKERKGKEKIAWTDLPKRFPDNTFN